jgi:hypothetical protein
MPQVSHYMCECPGCGMEFPSMYNDEFLELKGEIPAGQMNNYSISHYGCKYIPHEWSVFAKSKHFILYKENK